MARAYHTFQKGTKDESELTEYNVLYHGDDGDGDSGVEHSTHDTSKQSDHTDTTAIATEEGGGGGRREKAGEGDHSDQVRDRSTSPHQYQHTTFIPFKTRQQSRVDHSCRNDLSNMHHQMNHARVSPYKEVQNKRLQLMLRARKQSKQNQKNKRRQQHWQSSTPLPLGREARREQMASKSKQTSPRRRQPDRQRWQAEPALFDHTAIGTDTLRSQATLQSLTSASRSELRSGTASAGGRRRGGPLLSREYAMLCRSKTRRPCTALAATTGRIGRNRYGYTPGSTANSAGLARTPQWSPQQRPHTSPTGMLVYTRGGDHTIDRTMMVPEEGGGRGGGMAIATSPIKMSSGRVKGAIGSVVSRPGTAAGVAGVMMPANNDANINMRPATGGIVPITPQGTPQQQGFHAGLPSNINNMHTNTSMHTPHGTGAASIRSNRVPKATSPHFSFDGRGLKTIPPDADHSRASALNNTMMASNEPPVLPGATVPRTRSSKKVPDPALCVQGSRPNLTIIAI